jgi:hypothetical protein
MVAQKAEKTLIQVKACAPGPERRLRIRGDVPLSFCKALFRLALEGNEGLPRVFNSIKEAMPQRAWERALRHR